MLCQMKPSFKPVLPDHHLTFWKHLWSLQEIVPRIKIFVWKAVHRAISVGQVLHRRIPTISPTYQLCHECPETILHALFHCHHARATWFSSRLAIKTSHLRELPLLELLITTWRHMEDQQFRLFLSILWQIWKARCSSIHDNKPVAPLNSLSATYSHTSHASTVEWLSTPEALTYPSPSTECAPPPNHPHLTPATLMAPLQNRIKGVSATLFNGAIPLFNMDYKHSMWIPLFMLRQPRFSLHSMPPSTATLSTALSILIANSWLFQSNTQNLSNMRLESLPRSHANSSHSCLQLQLPLCLYIKGREYTAPLACKPG